MNLFHTTNYKLYRENLSNDFKVAVISDLHFSYKITNEKLRRILGKLEKENPNYILFPGDIIDSTDMIEEERERDRLLSWIRELGIISPTLISLGSHDYFKKNTTDNEGRRWLYRYPNSLIENINNLNNVHLLDNSKYEDDNLFVTGYTQSMEYYQPSNNSSFGLVKEDKQKMIEELKELRNKIGSIPKNKISLLLAHSPVYLRDSEVTKEIEEYDYYISGHMHNGCVPPILYELWNSSRGLIAPNKQLFPDNERNTLKTKEDKLIVNGPLTTFHECVGMLQVFNMFYPSYFTTIDFTKDSAYNTSKVKIRRGYNK